MTFKQILICSKEPDFLNFIQKITGELQYSLRMVRAGEELQSLEPGYEPTILIIDCVAHSERNVADLSAVAWKKFPYLAIALVYRSDFSLEALQSIYVKPNVLCLQNPYEMDTLLDWMLQVAPVEIPSTQLTFDHMAAIRISDLGAEESFNFDLYYYMPSNKKFLHFRRKETGVTQEQIEKFKKHNVRDLFIRISELPQLHKYLAARLTRAAKQKSVSALQKRKNLKSEAKEVIRIVLGSKQTGIKESRMALESCKQVALLFIKETSEKPELLEKMKELAALGRGSYNHAINVSIYCTLFAMVLEEPNLEAASVGGLLHDIGFASFDKPIDESKPESLDEVETAFLRAHPDAGVKTLGKKKLLNTPDIHAMILGHHEYMDGSGYPAGLKESQITPLSRICAIADQFDQLTSLTFGTKPMDPLAAIDHMIAENSNPDQPYRFDHKMLSAIRLSMTSPNLIVVSNEKVTSLKTGRPLQDHSQEVADKHEPAMDDSKRRRRVKTGMKY